MKTLHTPEPWFCDGDAIYNNVDCAGDPIAHVLTMPFDDAGNACDARRIVACVNACAGISTENLEQNLPVLELAKRYNATIKQRDQLLAALEGLLGEVEGCMCTYEMPARAAIAAVKGN